MSLNIQPLLWAFDPHVYGLTKKYRVTDDKLLPLAYQDIPGGCPEHKDWFFLQAAKRIDTARRVPLPFRLDEGVKEERWMICDLDYPHSPGLRIELREVRTVDGLFMLPHALIDCAVEDSGYASFSAYLDGAWVPSFKQYRKIVGGRRLAYYSGGLKQDVTATPQPDGSIKSDWMGWLDPPTCSWNKVK